MANSGSNSALKFTGIAVAVIAGSALAGYFLAGGVHPSSPSPSVQATPEAPIAAEPRSPDAAVRPAAPRSRSDDYTAPGAPAIHIREQPTPTLKSPKPNDPVVATNTKTDMEASQEDPPKPIADTKKTQASDSSDASANAPSPPASDAQPQTAPSDADYEKTPTPADSAAGQQDTTTPSGPIYRVQAGTFDQARNAHMLADVLRDRGYTTSTVAERKTDKTVYHVQTGAYRSKSAAKQSALDLQRMGYPAYVASGG